MQAAERLLRRADKRLQQRAWIAFPYAVMKKFGDDQAGNLAALIAYYGFLSLFPLMLVLVTLLSLLLRNNPELQDTIRTSALASSPVLGVAFERAGELPDQRSVSGASSRSGQIFSKMSRSFPRPRSLSPDRSLMSPTSRSHLPSVRSSGAIELVVG